MGRLRQYRSLSRPISDRANISSRRSPGKVSCAASGKSVSRAKKRLSSRLARYRHSNCSTRFRTPSLARQHGGNRDQRAALGRNSAGEIQSHERPGRHDQGAEPVDHADGELAGRARQQCQHDQAGPRTGDLPQVPVAIPWLPPPQR